MSIPVFAINLKKRQDRKRHIIGEFNHRDEFDLSIVEAEEHEHGATGLWRTIRYVLQELVSDKDEFIIICEDDHVFTENYTKEYFLYCLSEAKGRDADVISGGVSWFNNTVQVSENLFWIQLFGGLQFTIIFRKFYHKILEADFNNEAVDHKIGSLTNNKFVIHPFISTQKEFGYSDVTPTNAKEGRVAEFFDNSSSGFESLKLGASFYQSIQEGADGEYEADVYEDITIPTYVINLPDRRDRRSHIEQQFAGKPEFNMTVVEAIQHEIGAIGLWATIRKIVESAMVNDKDVIIICEDDHEFTEYYSRALLLKNIIEANEQGVEILSGGIGSFTYAAPITSNRFWMLSFYSCQFMVLYKSMFQKILDEPFYDTVTADDILSEMTSNKMVLFPFISVQKEFGYSDVNARNSEPGFVSGMFTNTFDRLEIMKRIHEKYMFGRTDNDSYLRPLSEVIHKVDQISLQELLRSFKHAQIYNPAVPDLRIIVHTRSQNQTLYDRMMRFIPADIKCVRHTGYSSWKDAATFLHDVIDMTDDMLLVLDEDAFITDWSGIEALCEFMKDNGFTHAGMPDGGAIHHRTHSFVHMNPFFAIFNCGLINPLKAKTSRAAIDNTTFLAEMEQAKPEWINGKYVHDNIEPFAGIFYWLSKVGKPLFLQVETLEDNIATMVKGIFKEPICLHSWFSRLYDTDAITRRRIDRVYERALKERK